MNAFELAKVVGATATVLSAAIPVILWLVLLRPWKPKTRLMYAIRFSLWPIVVLSFNIAGPVSRKLYGINSSYLMSLGETLKGLVVLFFICGPVFFGIGWWRGKGLGREGSEQKSPNKPHEPMR